MNKSFDLMITLTLVMMLAFVSCSPLVSTDSSTSSSKIGKWTVTSISSTAKGASSLAKKDSSVNYAMATKTLNIPSLSTSPTVSICGETEALKERLNDPTFGLFRIVDPSNGIDYEETADELEVQSYYASLKDTTPSDVDTHEPQEIAVQITGLPGFSTSSSSVARGSVSNSFKSSAGGWAQMSYGWLFFGITTTTFIHSSTPSGDVTASIWYTPCWGGTYTSACSKNVVYSSGLVSLNSYLFGWWNYKAQWNWNTDATIETTISY